jgi:hypothetical protein
MRAYGAVCIVGAGASVEAGFPLVDDLRNLLWFVYDQVPDAAKALAVKLGRTLSMAQVLIGNDPACIKAAWEILAHDTALQKLFKNAFADLDSKRSNVPSKVHRVVAELLHRRFVRTVISLNWDTLLETNYRSVYGTDIPREWLWKPHGDVRHIQKDWILPDQPGRIIGPLARHVADLVKSAPHILLVLGYSESDEAILEQIIKPCEERWQVIRISPSARGRDDLKMPAVEAVSNLQVALCATPEAPGWDYVSFEHQRGLEAALAGYQLGATDISACPRPAVVDRIYDRLQKEPLLWLVGESGSGKSLAAFRAAFEWAQGKREVLRLSDSQRSPEDILDAVLASPRSSLFVVDDADRVPQALLRRLEEIASATRQILFVGSDPVPIRAIPIRIEAERAVKELHRALLADPGNLLAPLRQFDPLLDETFSDVAIEHRLQDAAEAKSPWQFMFILSAGWRRARETIADLHRHERADLLLLAIAIRQIVSLDGPANREWLDLCADTLERDSRWIDEHLPQLVEKRAVISVSDLRCPHRRFAAVVLELAGGLDSSDVQSLFSICRAALHFGPPPLLGVSWLLSELNLRKMSESACLPQLIDGAMLEHIFGRCVIAGPGTERRDALHLMDTLLSREFGPIDFYRLNRRLFTEWLSAVNSDEAYAFADFLNQLRQRNKQLANMILRTAEAKTLARAISTTTISQAYGWGSLLQEYWSSGPTVKRRFMTFVDEPKLLVTASRLLPQEVIEFVHLLAGFAALDRKFSVKLLRAAIPTLASAINAAPARIFNQIYLDLTWHTLGYSPFDGKSPTSLNQIRAAKMLIGRLDTRAIALEFPGIYQSDWERSARLLIFIGRVLPQKHKEICHALDWEALDKITEFAWPEFPRELEILIKSLLKRRVAPSGRDVVSEPVSSWVARRMEFVELIPPLLMIVAPASAAKLLREGASYDLKISSGYGWWLAAHALWKIHGIDSQIVSMIVTDSCASIASGFTKLQVLDSEHLGIFCKVIDKVAPGSFRMVTEKIDAAIAASYWPRVIAKGKRSRNALEALLTSLEPLTPAVAKLAAQLGLRRIKRGSRGKRNTKPHL